MDDVQDYRLNSVQNQITDLFLNRNQMLSAGLIIHDGGNYSKILQKIKELKKWLIELDIHGWDSMAYTTLGEREQLASLFRANEKMRAIWQEFPYIYSATISFQLQYSKSNVSFKI